MSVSQIPPTTDSSDTPTLGTIASKLAKEKSKEWIDHAWTVIYKSVTNMARQGLFHCTVRFEDMLICDIINQQTLLKYLGKQDLRGEFKNIDGGVELAISWGE
mmetsp:Transcript_4451/g.6679  ORF Transcript_4451/g.6679 Transcript_4451/m.6679 type:complete len:103 (-) Transcript_4451:47-355(-)